MQLKMYWFPGTPVFDGALPEGYAISNFAGRPDVDAWLACCRDGLIADDDGPQEFASRILARPDIDPKRDVFFLDYQGEHIGTATCYVDSGSGAGDLHMVGIKKEYRGKGLAKYLTAAALNHIKDSGVPYVLLTTDEWRENAVRSYLKAGFKPVQYGLGMEDRWQAMLETLGIDSAEMVYDDATPYKTVYRSGLAKVYRFGVFGAGRGWEMMKYSSQSSSCQLVAICDKNAELLKEREQDFPGVRLFTDFDAFLQEEMDFVVLANYANEHAPFAMRAMRAGKAVLSEVLPVQTMAEAVALVETVEQTGMVYGYVENCCYMPGPKRMRELYRAGKLGTFEYGEGEYMHNCEPIWHNITRGEPDHWRNTMSAFYYGTHSLGPLIHVTGLRPVSVTGFEGPYNARMRRMGALGGPFGVALVTLENGAILKSLYGVGPSRSSLWYSLYGSKGRAETAREDTIQGGGVEKLYTNLDEHEGDNDNTVLLPDLTDDLSAKAAAAGHNGSDYLVMYHFVEKLRGNKYAEIIDVYEALDMFLPALFAYRSVLEGKAQAVPNLRDKAERDKWRNDVACTDKKVAGESLQPSYSKGNPDIPPETYDFIRDYPRDKQITGRHRAELGCALPEDE